MDCHLHTVASGDAWTTLDHLAERVRECRLDVVCITDHNVTSEAVAAVQRGIGCRVIVGEEIRTPSGDVIGLFLTERIPYVLPLPRWRPGSGPRTGWSTRRTRSIWAAPAWARRWPRCAPGAWST